MIQSKMSASLQLAIKYEKLLTDEYKSLFIANNTTGLWELIMEYTGSLEQLETEYNIQAYDLEGGFAQLFINKVTIANLSNNPQVIYLGLPSKVTYSTYEMSRICNSNIYNPESDLFVTGEGILLAVIDSGIRYNHPDFIEETGETRIAYLWDQTLSGTPPTGFSKGVEFSSEQINKALNEVTVEAQQQIVPSQDKLGHGTALTGIAGGNGRGSSQLKNRGVAPKCQIISVKLGREKVETPRDIDIMQGIHYAVVRGKALLKPMTLLIGSGYNLTGHDGTAPLERYIDRVRGTWLMNGVIPTGNEGNTGKHTSGKVEQGQSKRIQLSFQAQGVKSYSLSLWKRFSDDISLVIEAPNGEKTDELSLLTPTRAYLFDETAVLITFSEGVTSAGQQEIYILMQGQQNADIQRGLWTLNLTGNTVLEGDFNIWGEVIQEEEEVVQFLSPENESTLTSPGTTYHVTTVAGYNASTGQLAPFSGRGFIVGQNIKPDIAAPSVNIVAPSAKNELLYDSFTGTSAAAAFVAGAYVLMQAYGILQLGNINLYGDILKVYLLKSTKKPSSYAPYPNENLGYGLLCIEAALLSMQAVNSQSID